MMGMKATIPMTKPKLYTNRLRISKNMKMTQIC